VTRYRTIVADPPWTEPMTGQFASRHSRPLALTYPSMTVAEIEALPVADLAERACHLWLWTTNRYLEVAFDVMRAWGFTYLTTVTWVKPSGMGAWFASTTQHCLFGYYQRCEFPGRRWAPTHFHAVPPRHSQKPEAFLDLVEEISPAPRLELFARRQRLGWDTWGDEALEHVRLSPSLATVGHPETEDL
jgi:N6-adenosine-specific RNA methylase IME4